ESERTDIVNAPYVEEEGARSVQRTGSRIAERAPGKLTLRSMQLGNQDTKFVLPSCGDCHRPNLPIWAGDLVGEDGYGVFKAKAPSVQPREVVVGPVPRLQGKAMRHVAHPLTELPYEVTICGIERATD